MKKFLLLLLAVLFLFLILLLALNIHPKQDLLQQPLKQTILDETEKGKVIKYAQTGTYEVFTLYLWEEYLSEEINIPDQTSCDDGTSACRNIIAENGEIFFETVNTIGSFYQFTPRGIIFRYTKEEDVPCSVWLKFFTTYYDVPTKKMLYGIYSELSKGTPLTPQDEFCVTGTGKTEDIQRTTTSERQFFDEPYFNSTSAENLEKLALNMQAESIEEAFELYYASILTPSDCERPDIQVGDYLLQACDIGAMNTETAHDVYQETYNVTDVSTVCPLGYHVPTWEEWSDLLTQRHQENPSHGGSFGTNGITAWILDWSQEDREKFQNDLQLLKKTKNTALGTNYLSSNKSPHFPFGVYSLYVDTTKVEIQNYYYEGYEMLVRCFKDTKPTPSECDSPDIQIGEHIISACNVGATKAGTGEEAYGTYYPWEKALTACPSGYHLPSIEERQEIAVYVNNTHWENPWYQPVWKNGGDGIGFYWSGDGFANFQKSTLFPLPGKFAYTNETAYSQTLEGWYWSSTPIFTCPGCSWDQDLIQTMYLTSEFLDVQDARHRNLWLPVRCFKNRN